MVVSFRLSVVGGQLIPRTQFILLISPDWQSRFLERDRKREPASRQAGMDCKKAQAIRSGCLATLGMT